MSKSKTFGFTLIELIIVVAIIALLAAATFVAIDPAKRIGEAQNAQRWSDITAILSAIMTYIVDNNGNFPTNITADGTFGIGSGGACDTGDGTAYDACVATTITAAACKDIKTDLLETYLATIPVDPASGLNYDNSGYYYMRSASGRITVGACTVYGSGGPIQVSR